MNTEEFPSSPEDIKKIDEEFPMTPLSEAELKAKLAAIYKLAEQPVVGVLDDSVRQILEDIMQCNVLPSNTQSHPMEEVSISLGPGDKDKNQNDNSAKVLRELHLTVLPENMQWRGEQSLREKRQGQDGQVDIRELETGRVQLEMSGVLYATSGSQVSANRGSVSSELAVEYDATEPDVIELPISWDEWPGLTIGIQFANVGGLLGVEFKIDS